MSVIDLTRPPKKSPHDCILCNPHTKVIPYNGPVRVLVKKEGELGWRVGHISKKLHDRIMQVVTSTVDKSV